MDIFQAVLILATFLCSLVSGFLFAYAIVIMPGIKNLTDKEFIRAFQVTDRIIQNNQPIFILVWVGSAIALIISTVFGFGRLEGFDFLLLSLSSLTYILGVQLPTIVINLPLNNKLQTLDIDSMNLSDINVSRNEFELRWNKSNVVRTALSCFVSVLLIILLFRL